MGLTRIRAEQISDIDYKQAVRVITLSDVTLSGGAPATVDGVNLSAGNRVLVAGQSTGSQNGLYEVQTVGAGSNGTWIRSTDGNATGEIEAGMIVMVTEGDIYKDTQWKLTTNDPIVIGTTALVFEQNSAYAFGNIYANGTAVLANSVGGTVTLTAGDNIAITGNNTSKTVTIGVTGISLNSIANGTSNVTVVSSGGDVTVGVGGTSNVAVFSTAGVNVTGNVLTSGLISATGNVSGGNIIAGTGSGGNISGANVITANAVTTTGNITGGNILTAGLITATGNVTSGNLSTTLVTATTLSATGNVQGGNLRTAGLISATGNIDGGNLRTAGLISATGNVNSGNMISAALVQGVTLSASGNVTGGNVVTAGLVSATGEVSGATLRTTQSAGDEGGQVDFALPTTNTTLNSGVAIDVYQNRVRIFETGGTVRGGFFDLSTCNAGASTNFLAGGGGGVPGGSNTQVQFNDASTFGGSANFTFDKSTNLAAVGGTVQAKIFANPKTLTTVTLPADVNALVIGPVTIPDGNTITVPSGSTLQVI